MRILLLLVMLLGAGCARQGPAPKRLLLVTTTTGFRHSSIELGEKAIRELAAKSGDFTVISTSESRSFPDYRTTTGPALREAVRRVLAEYLSPAALAHYDGVLFLSPVDEPDAPLPIPDRAAFYAWIAAGHGFIGVHAASDCLHQDPGYIALLGGEFLGHGRQAAGDVVSGDPAHPATAAWGRSVRVFEEFYHFKPASYDPTRLHLLLGLTARPDDGTGPSGQPGWLPLAWARQEGKGRVFYTALGHREDLWDPDWKDADGKRANPAPVAEAFQQHLLGGIRWALGLVPGDATPQVKPDDGRAKP
jgi:type 1 glutamine amidotransferase